ncbi:Inner nuclear membrane protein SRC1 [Colletotrichum sp. SAR 10_86]|nr:Inner nuclear membrane protein SRC1 [Colletotrichum sp. SAR 10_86]KAJ4999217.1 Inner nuclear membrane protein SRC1 [Colletotrichum sp. SAR 10_66]
MVQTRSGKQTRQNVPREPIVPLDEAQITSMIPDKPAYPKAETRPFGRHPDDFTIDLKNLSEALQAMNLQNTEAPLGEVTAGDTIAASSQPLDNVPSLFDDTSYLAPDFNPTTLKIPTLRNLLLRHNIPYPPTHTKKVLVDIFVSEIQPRAAATLVAMAKVQRDEKDIVDVGND